MLLDFAQQEQRSQLWIEPRQSVLHQFFVVKVAFLVRLAVHEVTFERNPSPTLLLPQMLQRLVDRHAVEPRLESRLTAELAQRPKDLKKHLLQEIVGVIHSHHPHEQLIDPLVGAFVKPLLSLSTATTARGHKVINWLSVERLFRPFNINHGFRCGEHGSSSH